MVLLEKTVLLCGGRGTRLWPLTIETPKPLVKLAGKPVVEYLMNLISKQGFNEFVICTGYKAELVEKEIRGFAKKDWIIEFVNSGEDASILTRIKDAAKHCGERFIVCYGDTIADVPIKNLMNFHESHGAKLTNVLYQMESPFGLMETNDGLITSYKEKPMLPFWFNIGFFVFEKKLLENSSEEDWIKFLQKLVSEKKLFGFKHQSQHLTFNTEKEREDAEKKINAFSYVFE